MLRVQGDAVIDAEGAPVLLRGVGLGGWMNMENFITGYPANESAMRDAVGRVLGAERAERFFDRLLDRFFSDEDAALLAELGVTCVRLPINQRHFERDSAPFQLLEAGFARLDDAIRACGEVGIYTVIDLHAVPGSQNQHWHSDNPGHTAAFWRHPHFQDRVVHLWQALAERYRGNAWVAGYNLLNEPGDSSGEVVGPFYERLVGHGPRDRPGPHPVPRRQHVLDRLLDLRRAGRERRLRLPRLRPRGDVVRQRPSGPRGDRGDVPQPHPLPARRPARRSGSASSARSTRATRSATRTATGSSPTSSRSTSATTPAGRCGRTRTSGCTGSSPPGRTAPTCAASGT